MRSDEVNGFAYGEYTYQEFEAPSGFVLDETVYSFAILEDGAEIFKQHDNQPKEGSITIYKTDEAGRPLPGVTFLLEASVDGGQTWAPIRFREAGSDVLAGYCTSQGLAAGSLTTGSDGYAVFSGLCIDTQMPAKNKGYFARDVRAAHQPIISARIDRLVDSPNTHIKAFATVNLLLTVQKVLSDDTVIERIADAIVILQDQEDPMLPAMRKQLRECEKGIQNLLNAIQAGIVTEATKDRLVQLEAQKESLQASILQASLERPKYTKEEIIEWISQFKDGSIDDKHYQKEIIETFVNSIYVFDDRLVFTYNYRNGTDTISLKEIEAAFCSDLKKPSPPHTPDPEKGQGFLLSVAKKP